MKNPIQPFTPEEALVQVLLIFAARGRAVRVEQERVQKGVLKGEYGKTDDAQKASAVTTTFSVPGNTSSTRYIDFRV